MGKSMIPRAHAVAVSEGSEWLFPTGAPVALRGKCKESSYKMLRSGTGCAPGALSQPLGSIFDALLIRGPGFESLTAHQQFRGIRPVPAAALQACGVNVEVNLDGRI